MLAAYVVHSQRMHTRSIAPGSKYMAASPIGTQVVPPTQTKTGKIQLITGDKPVFEIVPLTGSFSNVTVLGTDLPSDLTISDEALVMASSSKSMPVFDFRTRPPSKPKKIERTTKAAAVTNLAARTAKP